MKPIIKYLPEFQKEYDSLLNQYGRSDFTEFATYHELSMQVDYPSDLSDNMTIKEVIEFIKSYKIPQGIFLEEDGSGRLFEQYVENNPDEYSHYAIELLPCHELFYFRFLAGLSKNKNKKLDWNSILTFCEKIIITPYPQKIKHMDLVLRYLGDLLQNHLISDGSGIPFDLRNRVWKILCKAIEIAPINSEWEKCYPNHNWNALSISINSSMGRLWHAVIQYATWCHHELKIQNSTPTKLVFRGNDSTRLQIRP